MIIGNSADYGGGTAYALLNNCKIENNSAANSGGGTMETTMYNCLVISNSAQIFGGGTWLGTTINCTVVYNSGGGVAGGRLYSCIVYYNDYNFLSSGAIRYYSVWNSCVTTPVPSYNGDYYEYNIITNEPLFVNMAGGDFHLQSNSPCINSGINAYVTTSTDLDGNPRIVGGTVDIGAYEYQTPTSVISYAWLDQFGLPTDGSVDHVDLDGTGFNVYQDWIAGLNPTNSMSVLQMLPPTTTNSPPGLVVIWQSVSGITYFLQSSTNLAAQPAFSTIQSNIVGQTGTTTYTDTTATNRGPYFYRVGVQ